MPVVEGQGTAGTPASNVLTVQGIAGGVAISTSGGAAGGTSGADRGSFTFGTTNLTPVGGVFDDTPPAVLTTGMQGAFRVTSRRALHVSLRTDRAQTTDATVTLSTTGETTVLAAAASTFLDVTAVMCANTSASAVRVDFRDATAGTVRFSIEVPATATAGISLTRSRPQTTSNNNWTAQLASAVTDVRVWMQAEQNA